MLTETRKLRLPDETQEGRNRSWAVEEFPATLGMKNGTSRLKHEAAWCSTFSCLETLQTRDSAGFQRLKHEAAWCSTFSCLETLQTRDSAGFQATECAASRFQVKHKVDVNSAGGGCAYLMSPENGETGRGLSKRFQQPYE
ncbi:hypothetical protein T265_04179 [Opisthorchis viverrini]|uniref:Uncharacterized protein n=1 Tax=Opisthorchis viverrini TaxID=6198 RepID=A0A075AGU9_OPIVI|nr:hypothetical protein T265_04179 [Opisthorchis viverrini]KER29084.1 hypothetical protein T265_04179 [Opisthorchis viverrini]